MPNITLIGSRLLIIIGVFSSYCPAMEAPEKRARSETDDQIISAVLSGNNTEVENLLKRGANPNANSDGLKLTQIATLNNHLDTAVLLLRYNATPFQDVVETLSDRIYLSHIQVCALRGELHQLLKAMRECNKTQDRKISDLALALQLAAVRREKDCVRQILHKLQNLNPEARKKAATMASNTITSVLRQEGMQGQERQDLITIYAIVTFSHEEGVHNLVRERGQELNPAMDRGYNEHPRIEPEVIAYRFLGEALIQFGLPAVLPS